MTAGRRLRRAALVLVVVLATTGRRAVAALPDWATALASQAPPLPAGAPSAPFRVLSSEVHVAIKPDGSIRIRRRFATQVLNAAEQGVSTGYFAFDSTAQVNATRAWHLPPGEPGHRSREMPVDFVAGDAFLSDGHVRAVDVSGVRRGSLVFFEFEAVDRPVFLSLNHLFFENAAVISARYEVETPPGWSVRPAWAHATGPEPRVAGATTTWELRDLPPPDDQPLADPPADRAPLLMLQLTPPADARVTPAVWSDWGAVSTWYDALSRGRADVTSTIETAARGAAPADGFFDKVGANARFVRDSVRYTAVELGIGGYQPRPAADTLQKLYGDCKDKGTLYRALLAASGIPSYAVLVRHGGVDELPQSLPVWLFNHFVVAVPIPADAQVPPGFASAVTSDGGAGRVLVVDTTDDRAAIGTLPAALEGRRGLLIDGTRGRLVTFPPGDPASHRVERRFELERTAAGLLSIRRTTTLSGEFAAEARQENARSAAARRRRIESAVTQRWPDATVRDYAVTAEDAAGKFQETLTLDRRPSPVGDEQEQAPIFPWIADDLDHVPLGGRTLDVVYPHPMTLVGEAVVRGVPERSSLPPPQTTSGAGWSVTVDVQRDGDRVLGRAELKLSRTRFAPADFAELRRFWSAAAAAAGRVVLLRPAEEKAP